MYLHYIFKLHVMKSLETRNYSYMCFDSAAFLPNTSPVNTCFLSLNHNAHALVDYLAFPWFCTQFFWSRVAVFNMAEFMRFTVNVLNFNHISTLHFFWVWRWPWLCCPNFSCLQLLSSVVSSFLHFFFALIIAFVIVMWLEPWRRSCEDDEIVCGRTSISL